MRDKLEKRKTRFQRRNLVDCGIFFIYCGKLSRLLEAGQGDVTENVESRKQQC